MHSCPICEQTAVDRLYELYDDRYGYPGRFPLVRCGHCGHRFLDGVAFSDDDIQALYSDYYPRRSMAVEDYRPPIEESGFNAWLDGTRASSFRWVPPGVKVLDIGCGFGESLGYHASRGCEVWGVESDRNVQRIADRYGFKVVIGVFKPEAFPEQYFDVVTMDQVIEHMRDPIGTLAGVRRVLKRDGSAIVSTPNASGWGANMFGQRWINWHTPYHLQVFSRRSMEIAASRAGLKSELLGTVTSSEWLYYQWVHLATRPKAGEPSKFWTNANNYGFYERVAIKLASLAHRVKINHLITRLLDGLGAGDSHLFLLRPQP